MSEAKFEEIQKVVGYHPDIPNNWYVPAQQAWTYLAWCIEQLREGRHFRNDKDADKCMNVFETWIEDRAIAYGEERR